MSNWVKAIDKLDNWKVACVVAALGLVTFFTGLATPFQGDDTYQIVNNPPVHSITHIVQFFESSTFWNGEKLGGNYYRPMMTTVFSAIYTVFGAHTIAFHIVQLALYIASAFILFLVFKHFFKAHLALPLVLIFLVHPLNSQVVFSIPTMQDALFFFFGILALWVLINKKTTQGLWWAIVLLLLSLLSKESGIVFIILASVYLYLFDQERLTDFLKKLSLPVLVYILLKINAVGLDKVQRAAPIDSTHLVGRLLTAPSIIQFYLTKFIWPRHLADNYYWVYSKFSVRHVLIPLVVDLAVIAIAIYFGLRIRKKLASQFKTYIFFSVWTIIGIVIYLQIIPLDMTACETWFYFPMAGLFGMIAVALLTIEIKLKPEILLLLVIALVSILGTRSFVRGFDYKSQYVLAKHDITVSPGDYSALNNISQYLIDHQQYKAAAVYAQRSINIYPVLSNYNNLGVALEFSGNYPAALQAYDKALKYNDLNTIYENIGLILLVYSDPNTTNQFFVKALNQYPHDFKLWLYYSVFQGALGNNQNAKVTINNAAKYGSVPPTIYSNIMNNQTFTLPLLGRTILVR